ncbi:MAG: hypothetical protein ACKON7_06685 [Planctomycetaceae bacterium]
MSTTRPDPGAAAVATRPAGSGCEIASLEGESHAVIRDVGRLPPFLMNVVSDGDVWVFAGSNGGLTAGRRDPDGAIFPYRPADQLLHEPRSSGIFSLLRVDGRVWEPWSAGPPAKAVSRLLAKHEHGCSVVFEETHAGLGLRCRWRLGGSSAFGLVRHAVVENIGDRPRQIDILDGWHRLLPPGVGEQTYARFSYLAAAYMWHELVQPEGLLVSVLNAAISDRPEPAESLRATVAWSVGLRGSRIIAADGQEAAFAAGQPLREVPTARGRFGAYLARDAFQLEPGESREWFMVADTGLDHAGVVAVRQRLAHGRKLADDLRDSLRREAAGLGTRIASVDGVQSTADRVATGHHRSNALFNIMRGGLPADGTRCPPGDVAAFLARRNRGVIQRHRDWAETADGREREAVVAEAESRGDPQLARLAREYMPLCFGRRHGDPSRPWNRFSIRTHDETGAVVCGYAGNWRDIFQNWEALGHSHPTLLPAMVAVFLNATTADGYNAYRITREGIDWEVPDPADPWSHIGYWGDHQIVYLLRLLEAQERFWPGRLAAELNAPAYAYAVVPYRIVGFEDLRRDPRHSIRFETAVHRSLLERAATMGGDGRLLPADDGEPLLVSLAEKLLVPALVKLTNLVPGGGIWLNTQRPEWNDANNALAGWGLSVVTACHLRRYLAFVDRLLAASADKEIRLSPLALPLVEGLSVALRDGGDVAEMFERLGTVGTAHREGVYRTAFDAAAAPRATTAVAITAIRGLIVRGIDLVDETIRGNRRADGLFHAYNVLTLVPADAPGLPADDAHVCRLHVRRLEPMLEGQVAALSSGLLADDEAVALLTALQRSPLYRPDQRSYLLQPDRAPPSFLDRNRLPPDWRVRVPRLAALAEAGGSGVVVVDRDGAAHFHADLDNARDLLAKLERIGGIPAGERAAAADLWEEVFRHREFTGRSGTFFAFEGLGSIYWHMVAKLLVAVQECHARASGTARDELAAAYRRIRDGLGFRKTAAEYGAFPTDAYSHTPRHAGAQQPGMTGQVKEELLTRLGELGVVVESGGVRFVPELLAAGEVLAGAGRLDYVDAAGRPQSLPVPAGGLAFTFCQVPVVYRFGAQAASITVSRGDRDPEVVAGDRLPAALAAEVFLRTATIKALEVAVPGSRP